jgi:SpoIIAA-like
MLQLLDGFPPGTVAIRATGTVTGDDYREVFEPAMQEAAAATKAVRLLYILGEGFDGYDPGAVLADTGLGVSTWGSLERMAVVTDTGWVRHAIGLFSGLMHGDVRVFPTADEAAAEAWIRQA